MNEILSHILRFYWLFPLMANHCLVSQLGRELMKFRRSKLVPYGPPQIMVFNHLLMLMYDEARNTVEVGGCGFDQHS